MTGGTAQTLVFVLFLTETLLTSVEERQTIVCTHFWHNTNQHCRVRYYGCLRQPLSKQLYT